MRKNGQIIGQRIRHYRRTKELTQKELASEIGVAPSFIANVEQGQKGISLDKLVDICKCFNIGLSDLLPIETPSDAVIKEKMIKEIHETLQSLEISQVQMVKTMLSGVVHLEH